MNALKNIKDPFGLIKALLVTVQTMVLPQGWFIFPMPGDETYDAKVAELGQKLKAGEGFFIEATPFIIDALWLTNVDGQAKAEVLGSHCHGTIAERTMIIERLLETLQPHVSEVELEQLESFGRLFISQREYNKFALHVHLETGAFLTADFKMPPDTTGMREIERA